jgi:hypothetical protein
MSIRVSETRTAGHPEDRSTYLTGTASLGNTETRRPAQSAGVVYLGHRGDFVLRSTKAEKASDDAEPDDLTAIRYVGGTEVEVQFADGFRGKVNLAKLSITPAEFRLETIQAAGAAATVKNLHRKTIHIDAALLRAHSDPAFAAQLRRDIEAAQA